MEFPSRLEQPNVAASDKQQELIESLAGDLESLGDDLQAQADAQAAEEAIARERYPDEREAEKAEFRRAFRESLLGLVEHEARATVRTLAESEFPPAIEPLVTDIIMGALERGGTTKNISAKNLEGFKVNPELRSQVKRRLAEEVEKAMIGEFRNDEQAIARLEKSLDQLVN